MCSIGYRFNLFVFSILSIFASHHLENLFVFHSLTITDGRSLCFFRFLIQQKHHKSLVILLFMILHVQAMLRELLLSLQLMMLVFPHSLVQYETIQHDTQVIYPLISKCFCATLSEYTLPSPRDLNRECLACN